MRKVLALLVFLISPPTISAQAPSGVLGLDVVGTERLDSAAVLEKWGPKLKGFLAQEARGTAKSRQAAAALRVEIESALLKQGRFASVLLQKVPAGLGKEGVYLVLDVMEKEDKARRMPFRASPKGHVPDSSLLDAWSRYSDLGWEMVRKGELGVDRAQCPAFYCTWGSSTPALKSLEDRFIREVPAAKGTLARILAEDADPVRRANALYLLSYLQDGAEVSSRAALGLIDPDMRVREAAMRLYADMAVYHRDVALPVESVAAGLEYPFVEDRSRTLAVLLNAASRPEHRAFLVREAAPKALRLLRLGNPSDRDMAYAFLGTLSGESYGDRDYASWETWIDKASAELGASQDSPRRP